MAEKKEKKLGTKYLTVLYILVIILCIFLPLHILSACGHLKTFDYSYSGVSGGLADLRTLAGSMIFIGIIRSIAAFFAFRKRNDDYGYRSLIVSLSLEAFGILFTAFINHLVTLKPSRTTNNGYDLYIDISAAWPAFVIVFSVVLVVTAFNIWYVLRRKQLYGTVMILASSPQNINEATADTSVSKNKIRCPSCGTYNRSSARKCLSCSEPLVGLKEKQSNKDIKSNHKKAKTTTTIAPIRTNEALEKQNAIQGEVEITTVDDNNIQTETHRKTTAPINAKTLKDTINEPSFIEDTETDSKATALSKKTIKAQIALPTICFCRKCGKKLTPDSVFCNYCGTEIIKEVTDDEV